jgi:hypothetical protein
MLAHDAVATHRSSGRGEERWPAWNLLRSSSPIREEREKREWWSRGVLDYSLCREI